MSNILPPYRLYNYKIKTKLGKEDTFSLLESPGIPSRIGQNRSQPVFAS